MKRVQGSGFGVQGRSRLAAALVPRVLLVALFLVPALRVGTYLLLLSLCFRPAAAQDWAKPLVSNAQRVDLRDLGYPLVNEIPAESSAITSLLTASDGKIYGGTTGQQAYLLLFDPTINKVRHLGLIPGHESIHHALVEDDQGNLYLGTGRTMFEPLSLTPGTPGSGKIDEILWQDIRNRFKDYAGGRLYRYDPKRSNAKVKLADAPAEVEDLGIPVPGNSIYALAISRRHKQLYGLSYPDGHLFVYDLAAKKCRDLGPVDQEVVFHGPERDWRSLPRALLFVEDGQAGRVITSGTGGALVYHVPGSAKITVTSVRVPGDYNYVQFFKDHAVIECLAQAGPGVVYGGTCDGFLFRLDPVKMKLVNLGKPRPARRLRCLAVGLNGRVYLMAGERAASRPCQFYCYDPREGGFEELGLLVVDRSPHYYWRGYQFDAMTTGRDGTIWLGESERRSHLFMFFPQ